MSMDLEETQVFAAEYLINALVDSSPNSRFGGLGSVGRYLVQMASRPAEENAKLLSETTERTPEKWQAMEAEVVRNFVLGVLGMRGTFLGHNGNMVTVQTPSDAAQQLVQDVFVQYIKWAGK
jgi:hypothetical protein